MNRIDRIRREVFIGLACDGDYQRLSHGMGVESSRITIKHALEVLEGETKETP